MSNPIYRTMEVLNMHKMSPLLVDCRHCRGPPLTQQCAPCWAHMQLTPSSELWPPWSLAQCLKCTCMVPFMSHHARCTYRNLPLTFQALDAYQ